MNKSAPRRSAAAGAGSSRCLRNIFMCLLPAAQGSS